MSERLHIHPTHPQARLIERATEVLARHGLLLVPTDAGYAFAWAIDAVAAEQRVQRLRALDTRHPFTLLCAHLSEIGSLAKLDDAGFRVIKRAIPGPTTFILPAASALPRRLKQSKRRAVGCRIPDQAVARALLEAHGSPLLVSSVVLPEDSPDNHDPDAVAERLLRHVDLMLDAGPCPQGPTTIIDLCGDVPELVRTGAQPSRAL